MPPHADQEIIARIDRFERKFDAFMDSHNKTHEAMIVDGTRLQMKAEETEKRLGKIEECNDLLFSKVRAIQAKIVYFTGAGAVVVFVVLKIIDKYWK